MMNKVLDYVVLLLLCVWMAFITGCLMKQKQINKEVRQFLKDSKRIHDTELELNGAQKVINEQIIQLIENKLKEG